MEDLIEKTIEKYDLEYEKISRIRGGWLVHTDGELFLLKELRQREKSFELSTRVREYLRNEGLVVDYMIKNATGEEVTKWESGEQYVLHHWEQGEGCDFHRNRHLRRSGETLAEIHGHLRCFEEAGMSSGEATARKMNRYNQEMKRVYAYMKAKKQKTRFEYEMMKSYSFFYKKALDVSKKLEECAYRRKSDEQCYICHGEYNYHNVYFCGNNVFTTNYEKVHWGAQLMDLTYFLRKVMEKNNWNEEKGSELLAGYENSCRLRGEEREFIAIMLAYPMKYRKLMNQYMNGKKSFISQKSVEKLETIQAQEELKMKYLEQLY
ncbi:MAG: hypothetical protein J5972_05765 [Eubacterium sp.]|nr:hypothetical protein [Eubacterium sp.]